MIERNLSFQTFYSSREESNSPLIPEIIRIGKKLEQINLSEKIGLLLVSLRYGKRIIINSDYKKISEIKRNDIIEIIDYDPVKNNLLIIGPKQPKNYSPLHWMIHHARKEVNVIVQLNGEKILKNINTKIPKTKDDLKPGSFEMIKEVLKNLRNSKTILIENQGILFVGENLKDVENQINNIFK